MADEKKFRINRAKVGLTYSCPIEQDDNPIESKEKLLEFLIEKGGPCTYIVAAELHESGKTHYHAYVKYDAKLDTKCANFFDCESVHPNILNPGPGWMAYCKKHKDFITNIEENPFVKALAEPTIDAAVNLLWHTRPQMMAVNGDRIEKNMSKRMRVDPPKRKYFGPWKWPMLENIQSTILMGPSEIGKTQFAKAHFENDLFVSHIDKLKDFDPNKHDGIIFDDMDFMHLPRHAQIHLTDWDEERDINIRYNYVTIPANTRKIFTCNLQHCPVNQFDEAIARRINIIELN